MLKGIGASYGIAIGRALVITEEVVEIVESKVLDSQGWGIQPQVILFAYLGNP